SAEKNLKGLGETKTAGGATPGSKVTVLVIRPQEVVAAVQALSLAYTDYYGVVADYNRAQFRLYRALGQPAQALSGEGSDLPSTPINCNPTDRIAPRPPLPAEASRPVP